MGVLGATTCAHGVLVDFDFFCKYSRRQVRFMVRCTEYGVRKEDASWCPGWTARPIPKLVLQLQYIPREKQGKKEHEGDGWEN